MKITIEVDVPDNGEPSVTITKQDKPIKKAEFEIRSCLECLKAFEPITKNQKFCEPSHGKRFRKRSSRERIAAGDNMQELKPPVSQDPFYQKLLRKSAEKEKIYRHYV